MKRVLLILIFHSVAGGHVTSQDKNLNDLNGILLSAKSKKQKIDILNDFADTLCLYRNDTGRLLAQEAMQLSIAENYFRGIGEASHSLGLVYFRRKNDSALYFFKNALDFYKKEYPGFEKYLLALNNISRTFNEDLRYDSSLMYATTAVKTAERSSEPDLLKKRWVMFSCGAAANAYAGLNKYDSAAFYYLRAVKKAEELNNRKMLEVYLKGVSQMLSQTGNYDKAIEYLKKGILLIEDDDRALVIALSTLADIYAKKKDYYHADLIADSSLRLSTRKSIGNSVGANYATLGSSKMAHQQYQEALQLFLTGIKKAQEKNNSRFTISSLYRKAGEAYEALNKLEDAGQMYKKAIEIGFGDDRLQGSVALSMSKLMAKSGDYQNAYEYLLQNKQYSDSVFTKENRMALLDLNIRYETEKREQQLILLVKEKELQTVILQKQEQAINSADLIRKQQLLQLLNLRLEAEKQEQLLRISELDNNNFRLKQNEQQIAIKASNNKLELEKKERELSQNRLKSQAKWLWVLAGGIIGVALISGLLFSRMRLIKTIQSQKALIEQRKNISRDLHDEIGATLSGIAMYSHMVKSSLDKNNTDMAVQSANIIQESSTEMVHKLNDIVWLIKPQNETMEALFERLKNYTTEICATKNIVPEIKVTPEAASNTPPLDKRKNIYLICKEAINNAVKYSGATELAVHFIGKEKWLHIIVKDNGQGFNPDSNKNGNGLTNMRDRAEQIDGILNINTAPGIGCRVELQLKIT